jgi:hypothetical protein
MTLEEKWKWLEDQVADLCVSPDPPNTRKRGAILVRAIRATIETPWPVERISPDYAISYRLDTWLYTYTTPDPRREPTS